MYGGKSSEHDISIITAMQVYGALGKHKVTLLYVDREGVFRIGDEDMQPKDYANKQKTDSLKKAALLPNGFLYVYNRFGLHKYTKPQVAILAFHGVNGEDGKMAGLGSLYGLPIVNGSVVAQSVSMDKIITKIFLSGLRLPILPYYAIEKSMYLANTDSEIEHIINKISFPLIVKPSNLGSSIAIQVVKDIPTLKSALLTAFEFDIRALVEPALIDFTEINCAAYKYKDEIIVSYAERPICKNEILDFTDKYMSFGKINTQRIFPFECNFTDRIRTAVKRIYKSINADGVIRCDFLVANNKWYVNEINSIPGAFANYLFKDITFEELMDRLIEEAVKIKEENNKLNFAYESSVLQSQDYANKGCK